MEGNHELCYKEFHHILFSLGEISALLKLQILEKVIGEEVWKALGN